MTPGSSGPGTHSDIGQPSPNSLPTTRRNLVLHADDFGMNPAVNRGIIAGFDAGLLTSTSVLANAPAVSEAVAAWRALDRRRRERRLGSQPARTRLHDDGSAAFDLGVHLNLTQGRPLTGDRFPDELLDTDGRFRGVFALFRRLVTRGPRFRTPILNELSSQIERVLDEGVAATHLNGHQYVEMLPVVAEIIPQLIDRYRIPVVRVAREGGLARIILWHGARPLAWGLAHVKRAFAGRFRRRMQECGAAHPRAYFGTAHAGIIDLEVLRRYVDACRQGTTEIGIHPAETPTPEESASRSDGWDDPLSPFRPRELALLCSTDLADLLAAKDMTLSRLGSLAATNRRRNAA